MSNSHSPHPQAVTKAVRKFAGLTHPQWWWALSFLSAFVATISIEFIRLCSLVGAVIFSSYAFHNSEWTGRKGKRTLAATFVFSLLAVGLFFFAKYLDNPNKSPVVIDDSAARPAPAEVKQSRLHITGINPHRPLAGQQLKVNVYFTNLGPYGQIFGYGKAEIAKMEPKNPEEERQLEDFLFTKVSRKRSGDPKDRVVLDLLSQGQYWTTIFGQTVNQNEVAQIKAGNYRVYALGMFSYTGKDALRSVELCVWWNLDTRIVHRCQTHNKEE